MVGAVFISVFASFLWAITNHIDKFLVGGTDESPENIKTLLIFSTVLAGSIFSPIWLILNHFSVAISLTSFVCVFFSSWIYILATYLYFEALKDNDASIVVVMFQLIPVFNYFLALLFFKETLTFIQMIGSILIFLSAVFVSFDFEKTNTKKKSRAIILIFLSCICYSFYYLLFDVAIRQSSYASCSFWYQIGLLFLGALFLGIKSFRTPFFQAIKKNGKKYFSLNILNELLNLVAILLVNFANVNIPLALATVLNGFQGIFVFLLGVLGVRLFPKYFNEDLRRKVVIQKIVCFLISILGLIFMVL